MRRIIIMVVASAIAMPFIAYGRPLPSSPGSEIIIGRQRSALEHMLKAQGFSWGAPLFIRIFKAEKRLELWLNQGNGYRLFKSYPICSYGGKGLGPKTRRGDGRAPEGFYSVTPLQLNPYSRFHLAFNLGYPNGYDRRHGRTGGALMVHGSCVSIGCFAMTDGAMEEIYTLADAALREGQSSFSVHIFPFRMTQKNMHRHRDSEWFHFWCNLKAGYDWFELQGNWPPDVFVDGGRYVFKMGIQ